jgi:hypothetical protein
MTALKLDLSGQTSYLPVLPQLEETMFSEVRLISAYEESLYNNPRASILCPRCDSA